jgi:hypothetical protein
VHPFQRLASCGQLRLGALNPSEVDLKEPVDGDSSVVVVQFGNDSGQRCYGIRIETSERPGVNSGLECPYFDDAGDEAPEGS